MNVHAPSPRYFVPDLRGKINNVWKAITQPATFATVRVFGREPEEIRNYARYLFSLDMDDTKKVLIHKFFAPLEGFLDNLVEMAVLWYGGNLAIHAHHALSTRRNSRLFGFGSSVLQVPAARVAVGGLTSEDDGEHAVKTVGLSPILKGKSSSESSSAVELGDEGSLNSVAGGEEGGGGAPTEEPPINSEEPETSRSNLILSDDDNTKKQGSIITSRAPHASSSAARHHTTPSSPRRRADHSPTMAGGRSNIGAVSPGHAAPHSSHSSHSSLGAPVQHEDHEQNTHEEGLHETDHETDHEDGHHDHDDHEDSGLGFGDLSAFLHIAKNAFDNAQFLKNAGFTLVEEVLEPVDRIMALLNHKPKIGLYEPRWPLLLSQEEEKANAARVWGRYYSSAMNGGGQLILEKKSEKSPLVGIVGPGSGACTILDSSGPPTRESGAEVGGPSATPAEVVENQEAEEEEAAAEKQQPESQQRRKLNRGLIRSASEAPLSTSSKTILEKKRPLKKNLSGAFLSSLQTGLSLVGLPDDLLPTPSRLAEEAAADRMAQAHQLEAEAAEMRMLGVTGFSTGATSNYNTSNTSSTTGDNIVGTNAGNYPGEPLDSTAADIISTIVEEGTTTSSAQGDAEKLVVPAGGGIANLAETTSSGGTNNIPAGTDINPSSSQINTSSCRSQAKKINISSLQDSEEKQKTPTTKTKNSDEEENSKPVFLGYHLQDFRTLEFRRVTFAYPSRPNVRVLQDVSFAIRQGEHVGILGETGAGKTSVMALLLRLYDPNAGAIFLNDRDLREYNPLFLRKYFFSMVSQELVLLETSVKDNVLYGGHGTLQPRSADLVGASVVARGGRLLTAADQAASIVGVQVGQHGGSSLAVGDDMRSGDLRKNVGSTSNYYGGAKNARNDGQNSSNFCVVPSTATAVEGSRSSATTSTPASTRRTQKNQVINSSTRNLLLK